MALVVEDGTGVAGANTYLSLTTANTYFTERPNASVWSGSTDALRTQALLYACQWMEARYGGQLEGEIVDVEQVLVWPRTSFYDGRGRLVETGTIPQVWKDGQAEAALAHLSGGLNEVRDRGGAIKSVQAGSVGVVYMDGASSGRSFPFVDSLVAPLLRYGYAGRRLVRG